jgi:D-glycero-D-manno-heptose 1,7-bisphosphate phosphatase
LLLAAAQTLAIDLSRSVLIGDALSDLQAAQSAGCRSALVVTGRGGAQLALAQTAGLSEFHIAHDLQDAVTWVYDIFRSDGTIMLGIP